MFVDKLITETVNYGRNTFYDETKGRYLQHFMVSELSQKLQITSLEWFDRVNHASLLGPFVS